MCLFGQTILETSVAELIDRSDCPQDVAFTRIFQEAHEVDWGM